MNAIPFNRREPGVPEGESLDLPPHSIAAEQSTLGGLLLDSRAWPLVRDVLTDADFYRADHRTIWRAFERVLHEDQAADLLTVSEALLADGELEDVGGIAYLQSLVNSTPSAANVVHYARIVRDRARQRELAGHFEEMRAAALAQGANVDELRAKAETQLEALRRQSTPSRPLDLRDLATRKAPPREWALLYWIALGHGHLLVGPGGIGKSTLLLQLGACLALGRHFVDEIPAPLKVLLWACEDDPDEIWRRLEAVAQWLGVSLDALADNFTIEPRLGMENVLFSNQGGRLHFTPTFHELRTQVLDLGAQVVMLDNLAHLYGADENRRFEVTTFTNGVTGALPGRAIIYAGHPSRGEGSEFSGSSAWENAVRARLLLGRTLPDQPADEGEKPDEDVRYLAKRKVNYSPKDWRRFHLANGVLVPEEVQPGGMVDGLRRKKAERVVLDGLAKLAEMGERAMPGATSPAYLPKLLAAFNLAEGCTRRELDEAMRACMVDGRLVKGTVGKYANRTSMEGLIAN